MKSRIIVLDANRKVCKLVERSIHSLVDFTVEWVSFIEDAKAISVDDHHLDIGMFIIGDVHDLEKQEVRKWAQELYMAAYKMVWLSQVRPPLVEIKHVVKTCPFDQVLEETIASAIHEVLLETK